MEAQTFAIITSIIIFVLIVDLIRRQKMTFKYSLFWLASSVSVLFLACHFPLVSRLAKLAGFTLTSNFIFFLTLVFFIILCLRLSVYANEQNSRTETLAQSVGILENKIKGLQQQLPKE